jgi:hypothetical protein
MMPLQDVTISPYHALQRTALRAFADLYWVVICKTALAASIVVAITLCGCGEPPTKEKLVGRWQSSDSRFVLDFHADDTFTKTDASPSGGTSMSMMGIAFIASSGRWSLEGEDLTISFGSASEGHSMLLRVVSFGDRKLVLRFGDHDSVKFARIDRST